MLDFHSGNKHRRSLYVLGRNGTLEPVSSISCIIVHLLANNKPKINSYFSFATCLS